MKRFVVFLIIACVSLAIFSSCDTNETSNIPNESGIIDISEISVEQSETVPEISEAPFVQNKTASVIDENSFVNIDLPNPQRRMAKQTKNKLPACIAVVMLTEIGERAKVGQSVTVQVMDILEKNEYCTVNIGDLITVADTTSVWVLLDDGTYRVNVTEFYTPITEAGSRYIAGLFTSSDGEITIECGSLPLDKNYQYNTDFIEKFQWQKAAQRYRSDKMMIEYGLLTEDDLPYDRSTGEWYDTSQ